MLSYLFSDNNEKPLYEQLYQYIRSDILSGEIPANYHLPSKRSLAKQLSISVITVENAYSQLMAEGYIYSQPRKGFYASNLNLDKDSGLSRALTNSFNKKENETNNKKAPAQPCSFFADFTSNATDPSTFPFSTWAKINRGILSEDQKRLMTNSPSNGMHELRLSIANHLKEFRGFNANPENIIIGAGTETIYSILIQLLGYNKIYATENPGYEKIYLLMKSNNVKTVRIKIDDSGIIPELLYKKDVDVVHTTPSHHFPTGITMPIKRRYELLSWANDSQRNQSRYIIEDDYDSEFRLSGLPIPSLFSIDKNERVIYTNTFTKSLASTIRISYMVLPDHLMNEYFEKFSFYSCPVSTFEQLTLARFMSEGHYEKHINRMRTASRRKRDLLLKSIKSGPLADISEISEEQSGLHFLINLKLSISDDEFIEKCLEKNIKITAVSERSFMVNYSSVPLERIEEAVNILSSIAVNK